MAIDVGMFVKAAENCFEDAKKDGRTSTATSGVGYAILALTMAIRHHTEAIESSKK